jgi:hypothetical protein
MIITLGYIVCSVLIVILVGMIALHVEFRLSDPDYSPGDPLPWEKLRQRWKR